MESCLCFYCMKKIEKGDKVFWVDNGVNRTLKPTCSKECAVNFKNAIIKKLKEEVENLEKQEIKEDIL